MAAPPPPLKRLRPWSWRFKASFRNFTLFLVFLSLMTFGSAFLMHLRFKRMLLQRCSWLLSRPLVCAHGGDTSQAVPNTFEAFNRALKIKADCIEIDASQTQDGVLVSLHDRDLQDIYGSDSIRVGDLTVNEITKLNIGYKVQKQYDNYKVPLLENAVKHVSTFLKQVIIDVKIGPSMFGVSLAADIIDLVYKTQCDNCVVWSKSDELVNELKQLAPNVTVGFIVMKDQITGKSSDHLRMKAPEVVGAFHGIVNTNILADIHRLGKKLFVWTVDDRETMQKMIVRGVDAIITNQPGLLQDVLHEIERECYRDGYSS